MCDYSIDSGTVKQPWLRDILVVKRVAWDGSGHAHHIYIITNFEDKDRTTAVVKQWLARLPADPVAVSSEVCFFKKVNPTLNGY